MRKQTPAKLVRVGSRSELDFRTQCEKLADLLLAISVSAISVSAISAGESGFDPAEFLNGEELNCAFNFGTKVRLRFC
jgi:hypothetical protein